MNFQAMNAQITNLFPAANTTQGGQLCTEFNLRSIDSVSTDPNVTYMLGPCFVHSESEFSIYHLPTKGDSTLSITAGKAVINGHFVECLADIDIDIAEGNSREADNGRPRIKGTLVVGLRMFYAENTTLIGDLDSDGNYVGVQVVVLPEDQFILPGQTPQACKDPDVVTAHIRLGSFTYRNGEILGDTIKQNPEKIQFIDFNRVLSIEKQLQGMYFSKVGLANNRLYGVSTKFDDKNKAVAEFCDATESFMVWDQNPRLFKTYSGVDKSWLSEVYDHHKTAEFVVDSDGQGAGLFVPHKQVDNNNTGHLRDTDYIPLYLPLPEASLTKVTPGIVNREYTLGVNRILKKINEIYSMPSGAQICYLPELSDRKVSSEYLQKKCLPNIPTRCIPGDYVIVGQDTTFESTSISAEVNSWPATMYIVLPGIVKTITYAGTTQPNGLEIASITSSTPISTDYNVYSKYWDLEEVEYRGSQRFNDYFTYYYETTSDSGEPVITPYYYKVNTSGKYEYSDPVIVTNTIPLATDTLVGGFLDIPDEDRFMDAGYITYDGEGHLILRDYELLRSGLLAYQLGSDVTLTGLSIDALQEELDQRVNDRIAFTNMPAKEKASNIINITIEIPKVEEDTGIIEIRGIDSRFNTCVYVHLVTDEGSRSNITVQFIDCQKLMIDPAISGNPKLELYRCNLYYDAYILNNISTITGLGLWYEQFDQNEPNLVVDHLTVRECGASVVVEDTDYFSTENPNDNHYQYALESLSFNPSGDVIGIGLYVRDCTSRQTLPTGKAIITSHFTLPHGTGLQYPAARFTRRLKVSGTFVSAYVPTNSPTFEIYVSNISFSVNTELYDEHASDTTIEGNISLLDDSTVIDSIGGDGYQVDGTSVNIPGINTNEFHLFRGGVIG